MQVKTVYFGDNEDAALAFVDRHWNRVVNLGFYSDEPVTESYGWYVVYAKSELAPVTVTEPVNNLVAKTAVKTKTRG